MITTTTTTNYTNDEYGISVELPYAPCDSEVHVSNDGKELTFLLHDEFSHWDEYEWGDTIFVDFSNNRSISPDEFLEEHSTGYNIYPVGKYEHGMVHYSIAGSRWYPDMNFDYGVCAYIAIPEDYQNQTEFANSLLDEYSSWCNGEVYCIVHLDIDNPDDFDIYGGFIGYDHATETAKAGGY